MRCLTRFVAPLVRQRPAACIAQRWCNDGVDIDQIAYGFMGSQALFAALEIGVFDTISKKGLTADAIASGVEKGNAEESEHRRRVQTLLNALTAHGLLVRAESGEYTNAGNTQKFLVTDSKYYYGDYLKFQVGRQFYPKLGQLRAIMNGEPSSYAEWFSDPAEAQMYTDAQHNGSLATARALLKRVDLSNVKDFLDVGGGSGAFAITLCRKYPDVGAQVIELPEVAKRGEAFVAMEEPEVAKRIKYHSGNALDDWGLPDASKDVVLMSYISGSVPEPLLVPMYKAAFNALRPGGRLIVHDFMVDDGMDGPALAANWAVAHVTVNSAGLGLAPAGVSERMRAAGFTTIEPAEEMIGRMTKTVIATR